MSTDAQLTTTMNSNLPTNGTGDIDANEHRTVVAALIESKVSREDDATKLGLKELDTTRSYVVGEGFILDGVIWQSVFGHSPGENPTSPGGATFFRITEIPTIDSFAKWVDTTTYDEGDRIQRNFKLYESLIGGNLDNDPALEDPLVNWVEISPSTLEVGQIYATGTVYKKQQIVYNESFSKFFWLNVATDTFLSTNFATELAAGQWEQFFTSSKLEELYVRNLGDVFVDEAYMTANYLGDKLGQKTVTNYQVAERTLNGWLITQIGANLSGWADYVDTRYTVGSPYSLADAATVVFPINTGTIVDSQKPLDINTMFYSAKLTLDDASVFEIGDTLTGATSGATGEIADILSNDVFIVNVSNTPFQNAEEVEAQDAATANTTAIDLEPAITGRNGDGLAITIEFKVKPDGAGANPRVKSSIDIVGGIGLIYERELTLSKGNGVEHFCISSFTAYTLDTWEANGGKITLEAINEDLLIYDFRLILTRTHKGR